MEPKRIGLDISKNVFHLHGVDQEGEIVLRAAVRRGQLRQTFSQLPHCIVGLEACGTAHLWGQQLASLGHEVRLITPHALTPYRERLNAGSSAAQALCEALGHAPFTRIKAIRRRARLGLIPIPARLLERLKLAGS